MKTKYAQVAPNDLPSGVRKPSARAVSTPRDAAIFFSATPQHIRREATVEEGECNMVYNPPVLKEADGEEPVVVTVNPARSGDAYIEQAKRAAAWITLLVICWLWQRLMCHFGLPPSCDLPMDALEVLTDLLALLVFGLTQVREEAEAGKLHPLRTLLVESRPCNVNTRLVGIPATPKHVYRTHPTPRIELEGAADLRCLAVK